MNPISIMVGGVIGYFLIALYNTLLKEKAMIQEGGEPLPSSSYVFLTLKHLIWSGTVWLFGLVIPMTWFNQSTFLTFVVALGYVIVTYLAATVIEVLIRTVVIYIRISQLKNENKNTEKEA